jgi:CCR4-NOT transcriptional regulation complex NOT5 subunit
MSAARSPSALVVVTATGGGGKRPDGVHVPAELSTRAIAVHTSPTAAAPGRLHRSDDNFDDHREDNWPPRACRSLGGFIRSISATPPAASALNPQNQSSSSCLTSTNVSVLSPSPLHTRNVDPARQGALGSRFASPHTVRSSLVHPLQSSARFGSVFRCAGSE